MFPDRWGNMVRGGMLVIGLATLAGPGVTGCGEREEAPAADTTASAPKSEAATVEPVERGKYLVTVGGCGDCHTPLKMGPNGMPEPDMSMMLAGHPEGLKMPPAPKVDMPWMMVGAATATAYAGPWGVSYAINLTPDSVTGLGTWTEDIFINALRSGKHWGASRPIMPPMPWQNLARATDEDLKAMYAYLRSIPPIKNKAPDYEPPAGAPQTPAGAPADSAKPM